MKIQILKKQKMKLLKNEQLNKFIDFNYMLYNAFESNPAEKYLKIK